MQKLGSIKVMNGNYVVVDVRFILTQIDSIIGHTIAGCFRSLKWIWIAYDDY